MFRIASVVVVVLAGVLFVPIGKGAAPPGEITPGVKFEGEIGEKHAIQTVIAGAPGTICYGVEIPVTLKAGQSITVVATVIGKNRKIAMNLLDPSGKIIDGTAWGTKTIRLPAEEVPANGKYKILVCSDLIGAFTLQTTSPQAGAPDRKKLEERLKALKKEVEEIEAQLKGSAKPDK